MKKLWLLVFIVCVGLFIPKNVSALNIWNNVDVDYRFFVDDSDGNLNFKLYDKSGTLNFNSQYDSNTKNYYFVYSENTFSSAWSDDGRCWDMFPLVDYRSSEETEFRGYVPFRDTISGLSGVNDIFYFITNNNLHGYPNHTFGSHHYWNFNTYIPLIIEEKTTHEKRIVFASFSLRGTVISPDGNYYTELFLVNNTSVVNEEKDFLNTSFLDNVDFIRRNTLYYSDELWEELNNGSIASTEISTNNKTSPNYKYVNQSIVTGERNVPEETLVDYAQSLPVLSFKANDTNDKDVVAIITNPKTWSRGVIILLIFVGIIVVGSLLIIIKRKRRVN